MKVQLKVIGGSKAGQLIPINFAQFLIGRAEDCHLKPRSELISRYHCAILSENGYVAVRDLGSKNGVFHNGKRVVMEEELKNGDILLIGPLEFEVILTVELKGETKPKVESVQEVVARAVEQSSVVSANPVQTAEDSKKPNSSGMFSNWLLDEGEEGGGETQEFDQKATVSAPPHSDLLADLPYSKNEEEKPEEPVDSHTQTKTVKADAGNTSDAAANLLKNFFKGGR